MGRPTLRERAARVRGALWLGFKKSLPAIAALALAAVLIAGAVTLYRWATTTSKFAVRVIHITPLQHARPEALLARMAIGNRTNILTLDVDDLAGALEEEPWVARATVRRELPGTLYVTVSERTAAAVVVMGGLYLADAEGRLFKRAAPGEGEGLPVITGIERESYSADPIGAQARVRTALDGQRVFEASPARAVGLSEIHVDEDGALTLYTWAGGTAIRLGKGDLAPKLARFDVVWKALGEDQARARAIFLGQAQLDRVIVRLAEPPAESIAQ